MFVATLAAAALSLPFAAEAKKHADPAMIAARSRIFGTDNVDQVTGQVNPERVIFSWLTNATFAASANGHVMLLDTFVTRLEIMPGRTPIVIQDLVDLMPEALFIGHGHFDHADNAAYIAQETGATIVASAETCDFMHIDAANNYASGYTLVKDVSCVVATSRGSLPGAEINKLKIPGWGDMTVTAFKHLHSTNTGANDPNAVPLAAWSASTQTCTPTATHGNTFPCNQPDSRDAALFPAGTLLEPTFLNIASNSGGPAGNAGKLKNNPGGPIAIWYHFIAKGPNNFTFDWHNSTGDIVDSCALPNNVSPATNPPTPNEPPQDATGCFPGVQVNGTSVGANLARIMDNLGPIDVQIGSVVSLGYNQNGERDIVSYLAHTRPKVFIPSHVTAVANESSSLEWKIGYYDALRAASIAPNGSSNPKGATYDPIPQENWPETPWLVDPNDYVRPLVYTPSDARWRKGHGDDHDRD